MDLLHTNWQPNSYQARAFNREKNGKRMARRKSFFSVQRPRNGIFRRGQEAPVFALLRLGKMAGQAGFVFRSAAQTGSPAKERMTSRTCSRNRALGLGTIPSSR